MRRRGFTLIELLVVVAIIALLISILLPALNKAKEQGRVTVCKSNVRQMVIAFNYYMYDWNGSLPGSTCDVITPSDGQWWPPYPEGGKTLCWLGSWWGWGDKTHIPYSGTIYKYVPQQLEAPVSSNFADDRPSIYRCPGDRIGDREQGQGPNWRDLPYYSYTSPKVLSGAPSHLLKRSRWYEKWKHGWTWAGKWQWAMGLSQPWLIVEEEPLKCLYEAHDGAWTNVDQVATRHTGRGTIGFLDGSVMTQKFETGGHPFNSWRLYYELMDGRVVNSGECSGVNMGFLLTAPAVNR